MLFREFLAELERELVCFGLGYRSSAEYIDPVN